MKPNNVYTLPTSPKERPTKPRLVTEQLDFDPVLGLDGDHPEDSPYAVLRDHLDVILPALSHNVEKTVEVTFFDQAANDSPRRRIYRTQRIRYRYFWFNETVFCDMELLEEGSHMPVQLIVSSSPESGIVALLANDNDGPRPKALAQLEKAFGITLLLGSAVVSVGALFMWLAQGR